MFTTLTIAMTLSGAVAFETPSVKAGADRPALIQVAAKGGFGKGNISRGNRQSGFGTGNISGGNSGGNKPFGNAKGSNGGNGFGHLPPGNGYFGGGKPPKQLPVLGAPQGNGNNYGGGNYGKPPKQEPGIIVAPQGNGYGAHNYGKPTTSKQDLPGIISQGNGNNYGTGNYGKPPKQELPQGYANGPSPFKPLEPNKGPVIQPPPGNPPANNNGISLKEQIRQVEQNKG
jgi:hypothetical protein